ncbi:hypothetical protein FA13DRAFT_1780259 [Coprinellus micaceus]|uniref:Uncharacterized protein n=1 Tax=Coprinellus micaceus TaxID=71717 RepID=A0A4Y7SEL9_COPMI|nr:hypothetical protein FA13DRAFT_1780259 [Coprinellus micaceus]
MHDYRHHRKARHESLAAALENMGSPPPLWRRMATGISGGMVIKGEEWDSIRLARAGCRRWQSVLFALRLYKGERSLNAFGERRPRSVRANIETRRINASMIALPSFPPSSGLPRPQGRLFSLSRAPVLQHPEQSRRPLEVVSGNLGEWVTSRDLALRRASRRRLNLSGDVLGYHPPHPTPSLALWDGVKPYETGYKHPIVSGVTLDSGDRPRWHWVATTRGFFTMYRIDLSPTYEKLVGTDIQTLRNLSKPLMKLPTSFPLEECEDCEDFQGKNGQCAQFEPLPSTLPVRGLVASDVGVNANPARGKYDVGVEGDIIASHQARGRAKLEVGFAKISAGGRRVDHVQRVDQSVAITSFTSGIKVNWPLQLRNTRFWDIPNEQRFLPKRREDAWLITITLSEATSEEIHPFTSAAAPSSFHVGVAGEGRKDSPSTTCREMVQGQGDTIYLNLSIHTHQLSEQVK